MPDLAHDFPGPGLAAVLRRAAQELRAAGVDTPGDDARRLVAAALGASEVELLRRPERVLSPEEGERLRGFVARRVAREPVSRIVGSREFYGRSFALSPATLDPRADSETLIEAALGLVREEGWEGKSLRILDVGTGSGCLLLTLLAELPSATGVGTDISEAALEVASENAHRLGLADRCRWLACDLMSGVGGRFDLVVSNPPYVPTVAIATLEPEVRLFDPPAALDGGSDGLRFFHRLATGIPDLNPGGWTVLEVGHDQADAVIGVLAASMPAPRRASIRVFRDVAGRRRCVAMRTRN